MIFAPLLKHGEFLANNLRKHRKGWHIRAAVVNIRVPINLSRKAATKVDNMQRREAKLRRLIEHPHGMLQSNAVGRGIPTTGPDMERDTRDIKTKELCNFQQMLRFINWAITPQENIKR